MSSLKTTNILHPSSSSNNIVLASTGATTIGGNTFPTTAGTNGQFLQTNGSGTASWATVASSQWTTTGSDIYYTTGKVLVGTSSGRTVGNTAGSIQIEGVTDTALTITDNSNGSAGDSTWLTLARTRGTAVGGTTAVANGDWLGNLDFAGHNGSSFNVAARISGQVDGAVSGGGVGDMPGRLVFSTTADGASSPTERLQITNDGKIRIMTVSDLYSTLWFNNGGYNTYKTAIVSENVSNWGRQKVYFANRDSNDTQPLNLATDTWLYNHGGATCFPTVGTTASGANAFLNSGSSPVNQLLRSTSSLAYKTDIEDIEDSYSEKIYKLHPIWYRSLAVADRKDWSWYGLGAEEVAAIEPRLVHYRYEADQYELLTTPDPIDDKPEQVKTEKVLKQDAIGIPDGVMYDRLTVLLLKELQKLNQTVKDQALAISILKAEVAALKAS